MGVIFQASEGDLPWSVFGDESDEHEPIRFKALTADRRDVPPVQYVEYPPGQADSVHSHSTGELFIVTDGELWLEGARTGPGGVMYIAAGTEYAVRAGEAGARYFRVVIR